MGVNAMSLSWRQVAQAHTHRQMPDIIWPTMIASLVFHSVVLFYIVHDVNLSSSRPVLVGTRNIVLTARLENKITRPSKKTEKTKPPASVEAAKTKPALAPRPVAQQKPKPRPESEINAAPVKKTAPEKHILIPSSEVEEVNPGESDKPTATAVSAAPESYTPPRSDARYLSNPKPFYPRAARRRGMQGTVVLEVDVDVDGAPKKVEIEVSSGFRLLDIAALQTVRTWRFVPAQRNGVAVFASVDVPIRFVLNEAN